MGYKSINKILQGIAIKAGKYMLSATDRASTNKTSSRDLVTVADIKSQNILERELKANFPGITVLSEEHSEEKRRLLFEKNHGFCY